MNRNEQKRVCAGGKIYDTNRRHAGEFAVGRIEYRIRLTFLQLDSSITIRWKGRIQFWKYCFVESSSRNIRK